MRRIRVAEARRTVAGESEMEASAGVVAADGVTVRMALA
jgi:hypothetical protein